MLAEKKIEICIPAFNEEDIIGTALDILMRLFRDAGKNATLIVSDNASTDRTAEIARSIEGVSVISIPRRGKGAAVTAAARGSKADIFGFLDADLSADPKDILKLIPLLERDECDVVIGSRLMDSTIVDRGLFRTLSSRAFNIARKMIVGVNAKDTQCGLKLMNARGKDILARCVEEGWFFDIEFLARAEQARLRIREVPIRWQEHRFPGRRSKLHPMRDSIGVIRALFRIRRRIESAI